MPAVIKTILDGIARVLSIIVGLLFMMMLVLVTTEVFSRDVLHVSFRWSFELVRYLFIYMTFFGAALCIRRGEMISINFAKDALPPKTAKIVLIAGNFVLAGFLVICIWFGIETLFTVALQTSPAMGISMWIPYLSVPVGSFFMLLFTLEGLTKVQEIN